IHNGIIENYDSIKPELIKRGYVLHSDTGTEVLANLVEEIKKQGKYSLEDAVRTALNEVVGAYAIVVMQKDDADHLVAARKGSPLVIGIGENEFFVASDASPIIEYTNNVVYLDDQEYACISRDGSFFIKTLGNVEKSP